LSNQGSGALTLRADAASVNNGGSITNNGTIDWSQSTGTVSALYDMNGSYTPGTLLANCAWVAPDYSGLVTQITGYKLVNTVQDLQNIESDMSGNYALGHDIDATGYAFKTLGYASNTSFTGQFDGMWHSVSYLKPDISFMSDIAANAVVRDVNLLNASAGFALRSGGFAGILAMGNHGTIMNTFTSGYIGPQSNFSTTDMGGLVGTNYGTIGRSGSSARVEHGSGGGGLVYDNQGTICSRMLPAPCTRLRRAAVREGLYITTVERYRKRSQQAQSMQPGEAPSAYLALDLAATCTGTPNRHRRRKMVAIYPPRTG